MSIFARSFEMMIAGRVLPGIGVAAPRVVTMALVRDQYSGRQMARLMSFTMAVFIIVPTIAPALGQGIQALAGWRAIFTAFFGVAAISFVWFAIRQPETLPAAGPAPVLPLGPSAEPGGGSRQDSYCTRIYACQRMRVCAVSSLLECGSADLPGTCMGPAGFFPPVYRGAGVCHWWRLDCEWPSRAQVWDAPALESGDDIRHHRVVRVLGAGLRLCGCSAILAVHGLPAVHFLERRTAVRQSRCARHGALGPHGRRGSDSGRVAIRDCVGAAWSVCGI